MGLGVRIRQPTAAVQRTVATRGRRAALFLWTYVHVITNHVHVTVVGERRVRYRVVEQLPSPAPPPRPLSKKEARQVRKNAGHREVTGCDSTVSRLTLAVTWNCCTMGLPVRTVGNPRWTAVPTAKSRLNLSGGVVIAPAEREGSAVGGARRGGARRSSGAGRDGRSRKSFTVIFYLDVGWGPKSLLASEKNYWERWKFFIRFVVQWSVY